MAARLQALLDAAQGRVPCDLILKNAEVLDVFSLEWRRTELAISSGVIVGVEPGLEAREVRDLKGQWVVPGFIDAHVHIESSLMMPREFAESVLACGTTAAICDPHELANVEGTRGIETFLDAAERSPLDLWVMLSSCVPATHLETNGGGTLGAKDLLRFKDRSRALGLAEVMNVPGVLSGDPLVHDKLEAFQNRPRDGHAPLLRGHALSAYALTGISSCHESSELSEGAEKLQKGMSVWIREGSVAKDLDALLPLIRPETSMSLGFCTDDRNPFDIAEEGHIDHLVRAAIRQGVDPKLAFRLASWSVARHYGLDRGGAGRLGAIAPGFQADLVVLGDPRAVAIAEVYKAGRPWRERISTGGARAPLQLQNSIRAQIPAASDLEGPAGRVKVIGIEEGKIVTRARVADSSDPHVARLSVLERYGKGQKPANAYVSGFGSGFNGAIASSVGHDSHNLIVAGKNTEDMRVALAALAEKGGGFCVVQNGKVLERLELPWGGLMSPKTSATLKGEIERLKHASLSVGCELREPFLQLAFLSLPVIPELKLTDRGLVDVERFDFVDVRA